MLARLRAIVKRLIIFSARDVTAGADRGTALVLAPHPDDETLGCGGVILRKRAADTRVVVVVVTDGDRSHRSAALSPAQLAALRRAEMEEAAIRLGIPQEDVRWLGFGDGTVGSNESVLVALIKSLIDEVRPTEVYSTCSWEPHPDHAAVGRAAQVAVRESGGIVLMEYPIWLWGAWPFAASNRLGSAAQALRLVVGRGGSAIRSGEFLQGKLHALSAHQSQLGRPACVSVDEPWSVLPRAVLNQAAAPAELFFRFRPNRGGS